MNKNEIVFLSITWLLVFSFFNPVSWFNSITSMISSIIPFHHQTLADTLKSARYLPVNNSAVRKFDWMIKIGSPFLTKGQGPSWINENVYVALVDKNGNILDDYQVKIENGKVVCYGKTPKVGGRATCGKPTIWVKVNENAVQEMSKVKTIDEGIDVAKNLIFSGDIDVYPKTVALKYVGQAGEILQYIRSEKSR